MIPRGFSNLSDSVILQHQEKDMRVRRNTPSVGPGVGGSLRTLQWVSSLRTFTKPAESKDSS